MGLLWAQFDLKKYILEKYKDLMKQIVSEIM